MAESQHEGHVFISYVRQDAAYVDRLQRVLDAANIRVWRDTEDLWPGQDWKLEIKKAINSDSLVFLACFSDTSNARDSSYQYEELVLATEQMRRRPPGRQWLIPIRFSDCDIPEYELGAGRSLANLQSVDLFGENWEGGSARLVAAILGILSNRSPMNSPVAPVAMPPSALPLAVQVKSMLPDPRRQIDLEDLVNDVTTEVREKLTGDEFSAHTPLLTNDNDGTRFLVHQARRYEEVVRPLAEVLVTGCTYGRPEHDALWARCMQNIVNADRKREGMTMLLSLQHYPVTILGFAAGLAAMLRHNYGALKAALVDAQIRNDRDRSPVIGNIHPGLIFENHKLAANLLSLDGQEKSIGDEVIEEFSRGRGKFLTPISDHLARVIRPYFVNLVPDDEEFEEKFDELEVLLSVVATDVALQRKAKQRFPYTYGGWRGSFTWRAKYNYPEVRLYEDLQEKGASWPPLLSGGLFGSSPERARTAFEEYNGYIEKIRSTQF